MEAKALQEMLIKILCSELNETELDSAIKEQLDPTVVSALYALSKQHDLAHIVSSSLYKNRLLTDAELVSKFNREEMLSIYRNEQMKYTYSQICEVLDAANIPYIPLKGAVLRAYYPKESMRTSCDIDILIREGDLNAAIDAFVQVGFVRGERDFHDVSLFSPNKTHLELHFNLQENMESLDTVLGEAWQHATLQSGSRYAFSDAFFLFYMFAHISYHFLSGGCGIRPLMDVWIMEHKMGLSHTAAKELLARAGIDRFAAEIANLAEVCFSGTSGDAFTDALLDYIFSGGVYGNMQNNMAMHDGKSHVTLKYCFKRVFVSCDGLIAEYPVLKKHRWMYLFCLFHRSVKLFFRLIKNIFRRKKAAKSVSETQAEGSMQLRNRLGL